MAESLRAEDFFSKRHRLLYETLLELSTRGLPIDFISVGEALKAVGTFQAVGGNEVLIELAQDVTSAAHVAHHARIVAHSSTLRRLIAEATAVIEEAYATHADEQSVRALLDDSEHRIFSIARSGSASTADPIRGILTETFERLEAKSKHELTGLNTGFYELNDKLCGLNRGDLIILAARPAMGKTALVLNMIEHAALTWSECAGAQPGRAALQPGDGQAADRQPHAVLARAGGRAQAAHRSHPARGLRRAQRGRRRAGALVDLHRRHARPVGHGDAHPRPPHHGRATGWT